MMKIVPKRRKRSS